MEAFWIIFYMIGTTILHALGDGWNFDNKKGWGHATNSVVYLLYIIGAPLFGIEGWALAWYVVAFILFRFVFFNPIWNFTTGVEMYYSGVVSITDRIQRGLPPHGWWWTRLIYLTAAVFIVINEVA